MNLNFFLYFRVKPFFSSNLEHVSGILEQFFFYVTLTKWNNTTIVQETWTYYWPTFWNILYSSFKTFFAGFDKDGGRKQPYNIVGCGVYISDIIKTLRTHYSD